MAQEVQTHTPEEWGLPPGYSVKTGKSYYHLLFGERGWVVNSVSTRFTPPVALRRLQEKAKEHAEAERNRNLEGAAPAMLEACKYALKALDSPEAQHVLVFEHERELLRIAIAQALGNNPAKE